MRARAVGRSPTARARRRWAAGVDGREHERRGSGDRSALLIEPVGQDLEVASSAKRGRRVPRQLLLDHRSVASSVAVVLGLVVHGPAAKAAQRPVSGFALSAVAGLVAELGVRPDEQRLAAAAGLVLVDLADLRRAGGRDGAHHAARVRRSGGGGRRRSRGPILRLLSGTVVAVPTMLVLTCALRSMPCAEGFERLPPGARRGRPGRPGRATHPPGARPGARNPGGADAGPLLLQSDTFVPVRAGPLPCGDQTAAVPSQPRVASPCWGMPTGRSVHERHDLARGG